ncbi:hypothetical protein DFP73DRAFT_555033 [Morchella snyderi]|nr:hypothetical protein DFP73DRAFT_555033 [Morchella snyderi]
MCFCAFFYLLTLVWVGALGFIFLSCLFLCMGALWLYKMVLPVFLYPFPPLLYLLFLFFFFSLFSFCYIRCFFLSFFIVLSFHSLGSLVQVLGLLVDSK